MERGFFVAHFDLYLISIKIGRFLVVSIFPHIKEYLGFRGESCIKEEKVPQISP
jgi:hypothetical protein